MRRERLEKIDALPSSPAEEKKDEDRKSSGRGLRALVNPKNVVDGVKSTFMKRPSNDRAKILLLIGTFLLDVFAMMGRHSVLFLFFRRQFHWTHADYSNYLTAFGVTGVMGQIVAIPFFSSKLRWSDTTILAVTTSTSVVNQIIIALSTAEWSVYVGAGIACLGNATSVLCRSQITKLIDGPLETGKVFAFMGALQALAPLVGRPLFGVLYHHTVRDAPSAFLCVCAAIYFAQFVLVLATAGIMRKQRSKVKISSHSTTR